MVVLIGLSRVYLGEHWVSDVLGGYLIGESLLGIAVAGYLPLKLRERKPQKKNFTLLPTLFFTRFY